MMKETMLKIISVCLALFVLSMTFASAVSAVETEDRVDVPDLPRSDDSDTVNQGGTLPVNVVWVKVDGDIVENGDTLRETMDRAQDLNVKVKLQALADVRDLSVEARFSGDEHFVIADFSENIDSFENDTFETVELNLRLPEIMDKGDYKLRITLSDRYSAGRQYNYNFKIENPSHSMMIRDVFFSPHGQVQAGRALLSVVRIENLGEDEEDSVRITVAVPQLNVAATDYIDEVDTDDEVSSEELYMRVPANAKPGVYDVVVTVDYDERTRQTEEVFQIEVLENPQAAADADGSSSTDNNAGRTVVTIGPESQQAGQGVEKGAVFPVTLTNEGATSKTYTLAVGGVEVFGTVQVDPSNVVLVSPGETKTAYVYVSVRDDAQLGPHTFSIDIKSGDKTLQSVPLTVNVVKGEADFGGVKRGLEIGLVVLIVILIVVGLVIAYTRSKKGEGEEEGSSGQQATYY